MSHDPGQRQIAIGACNEYRRLAEQSGFIQQHPGPDYAKATLYANLGILRALTELLENPL